MKPTLVADEMFPEGAGPYVELEEVLLCTQLIRLEYISISVCYFVCYIMCKPII